jgi:hypothetical protein
LSAGNLVYIAVLPGTSREFPDISGIFPDADADLLREIYHEEDGMPYVGLSRCYGPTGSIAQVD